MEKDIGKIKKNDQTDIVIGIREFNGKHGIDIREFTTSERYTGPTKKGLRIPANKFEEFKAMIDSIKSSDIPADTEGEQASLSDTKEQEESSTEDY